ncbi:hypothetical protein DL765_001838 [Monosporascus sp. GIB2]|nr:hypothetical protein DL765_001838 [Monosporascus sp. GIB2]
MENKRSDRQPTAPRARRAVAETGSFGKSTRRSRSRTGSAPPKREDANMKVADELFSKFLAPAPKPDEDDPPSTATGLKRKTSYLSQNVTLAQDDSASAAQPLRFQKEPTEVILRGYASPDQQYAAINHYEHVAGRICEDYSREPPIESRRYKSELRDPAFTRQQPLTLAERSKVTKVAGGEHWIKVTFESADAADAAIYASPQKILGHLVYAEPYRGHPPAEDAAIVDVVGDAGMLDPTRSNTVRDFRRRRPSQTRNGGGLSGNGSNNNSNRNVALPMSWKNPLGGARHGSQADLSRPQGSPQGSQTSTQTIDTATASTATVTGVGFYPQSQSLQAEPTAPAPQNQNQNQSGGGGNGEEDSVYCSVIPTARRVKLLPADEAVAPQPSPVQLLLARLPLIGWFSGSVIGDEVPRNEVGDFDLARASLFWRLMFYLDLWFGLFGSDLVSGDKED